MSGAHPDGAERLGHAGRASEGCLSCISWLQAAGQPEEDERPSKESRPEPVRAGGSAGGARAAVGGE